jgi:hypothetical protein
MQKTVTLVYSSDTFSRIMHNLSNNDDDGRHGSVWGLDNGKCVNLPVCVTTCSDKDTPLVITPVTVCLTTFFSLASSSSSIFHPFALYFALCTPHSSCAASLACFIIFHALSMCTQGRKLGISRGKKTTLDGESAASSLLSLFHVTHMSLLEIYVNLWCSLLHPHLSLPLAAVFIFYHAHLWIIHVLLP